ncbi:MAG: cation-translocating P-type ATPase [Nitrososphaerales archaeon]|nr:cation-translocating P-type ATPase [Nitrososphaerales archaeon]
MNQSRGQEAPSEKTLMTTTQFYVGGMACAFCASTIEKGLKQVNGVVSSKVLMESGEVFIKHDPNTVEKSRLKTELQRLGYYIFEGRENMSNLILSDSKKRALTTWAFAAISFAIVFPLMFSSIFPSALLPSQYSLLATSANFVIATIVFFYYAMPIHRGTVAALQKRILNEHVLYGVAGFAAYLLGLASFFVPIFRPFFFIAILLTGLHLTAGWLGARLRFNVEKSVKKLMDLRPPMARVVGGGKELQVAVSEVKVGDTILVRPGERVPLDGTVVDGRSEVSEAILTGESSPVLKQAGDEVIGGSTNGSGVLTIRTTSDYSGSYISRILGLVRSARQTRSTILTFFDRVVDRVWVPLVLVVASITLVAWTAFGFLIGNPAYLETGVVSALLVAVIGYPCAIGFSSPSVGLSVFSEYADNGILVKDASMFERLKDVKAVILDKTGTLTKGRLKVSTVKPADGFRKDEVLQLAALAESSSSHPIAAAIVEAAKSSGLDPNGDARLTEVSGKGVKAYMRDGRTVLVGKPSFLVDEGVKLAPTILDNDAPSGTLICVATDGRFAGLIDVSDEVREEAREVVRHLKSLGVKIAMLTGDNHTTAKRVAGELGIEEYYAELLPEDKVRIAKEMRQKYGAVVMVGDGVNDAPVLAASNVGVAVGTAGNDVAIEAADVALMGSDLRRIPYLLKLGKRVMSRVKTNIGVALGLKFVFIILAALGLIPLWFGVLGDDGVTLIVIGYALPLLRFKP